jgi:dolichyl-phosphate-mannose--protein O-mannosyl transferase
VGPDSSKPSSKKVRSGEDFDILIGFLGFWVLILFSITLFLEVTGKSALLPAMILFVAVLAIWGMIRLRRRLPARTARRRL